MFFNKLTCSFVFFVLLITGLAFVATPATAAVVPVLSVPDDVEDVGGTGDPSQGIQVYGIRAESVSFELTITFQEGTPPVNTPVTEFDATDIVLNAADSSGRIVPLGATASRVSSNADGSVYTTTITVKNNINTVHIAIGVTDNKVVYARTLGTLVHDQLTQGNEINSHVTKIVNILRSAAPPLTLSPDRSIPGNAPFTVTLTSTKAITLTRNDIDVMGGFIQRDGLSPDAAKRVWTVTIVPGINANKITVQPTATGAYIFPKGTFTVDTTGPAATITPVPIGGGVYSATITFDEPLQPGATLLSSELTVIGASIGVLSPIAATNSYVVTLIPDSGATTVTVQIKAGAVTDAGGVPNVATPSPAHTFRVAATATPAGTTLGTGSVTISEIMFATKDGTNDIQWIELFNSSKTETVALNAGRGWELVIENYNEPRSDRAPLSGIINFKDSGNVKTIPPRQTALIVSANGRNSDRTHFATSRVFDVYTELSREFGMSRRGDPFLHPTQGFHIELVDGRDNRVDEVGNLNIRGRTLWQLPNGWTADDDRTSMIRRYRRGAARDGTQQGGWIPAAETSFLYLSEKRIITWYGHSSDHGSPGIRAGGALPVQLSQFRPDLTETGAIVIQWTTESKVDNAGFNILRSQTKTGEFKVINTQLIPGAGTTAERNTYTWTDTTAKPNVVYYYQIEDVSLGGERQTLATVRLKGLVSATGKLTTQWGQLKRLRD